MVIEIFSDVVCPWCFIGKRRLDAALAQRPGLAVELVWRPFQLYPQLPADGMPREAFMAARFGAGARAEEIYQRIIDEGRDSGLAFDFAAIETAPNTLRAHRLLSWAEGSGRQHVLAEVLFGYYFQQGRDVGDPVVLAAAAQAAGLDGNAAAEMLAGQDEVDKVTAELSLARAAGITGVPCYVLDGRFAIPGAQSAETLGALLERAREKLGGATA